MDCDHPAINNNAVHFLIQFYNFLYGGRVVGQMKLFIPSLILSELVHLLGKAAA